MNEPTLLEWKVKIAEAKIAHLLELYKAKVAMLELKEVQGGAD